MSTPLEQARQRIEAVAQPTWKLEPASTPTHSKLGGLPDGPIGGDWPLWKGKPQNFLARIDLAELHAANGPDWLPTSGSLLFFYDQEEMVIGLEPTDRGGWTVRYLPPEATGATAIPEIPQRFSALPVTFVPAPSWPSPERIVSWPEPDRFDIPISLDDEQGWIEWESRYNDHDKIAHRIGGWPSPIQNDTMEDECQLASMGVDPYSDDPRKEALLPGAKDWRLLLQFDSDYNAGWIWGDLGRLYFWVREAEARTGNFANCWMILQCG